MAELQSFDVIFIGGGPAGYTGAIRAAQLGQNVACVEVEPRLGGTCLRVGCIPSKALLESSDKFLETKNTLKKHGVVVDNVSLDLAKMLQRKETIVTQLTGGIAGLFKKNKIARFLGHGRLDGAGRVVVQAADGSETAILGQHIIVATGSVVTPLKGVELNGDRIGTSTEALSWAQVPEHLVVIGGGVIGLELGSVWLRLGAKVTVLEYADRILAGTDLEVANAAQKLFKRQGIDFKLGVRVTGATLDGNEVVVTVADSEPIRCSHVLLAVGRKPNTQGLALESVGITPDARGQIPVDAHFHTTAPGIYAVGDVIHGPMLAHKAEEDAVACVEQIVNGYGHVDYNLVPGVVYTEPEIATIGQSEDDLKKAGIAYRKGNFPFAANGRAIALGHTDGFVKLLADAQTDRVLGCAIIGPRAGDLIAEVAAAMTFGASSEDVARTCHAHPTLAEVVKEAALAVDGRAVNI